MLIIVVKMVRRCCVPKCKSKKDTPVHRFPHDVSKAEQWLRTITRTDLIGNVVLTPLKSLHTRISIRRYIVILTLWITLCVSLSL